MQFRSSGTFAGQRIRDKQSEAAKAWVHIAVLAALGAFVVGCSSSDPNKDTITLGTGQGQGTDPTTLDFPIFYVKRPVPVLAQNQTAPTALDLRRFDAGADLYMRSSASPSGVETNLTAAMTNNLGDVRDVDVSFDGRKVVFAMRFPYDPNLNENDQPASWDIYEYDIASGTIKGLLVDPLRTDPNDPRYDDRFPHYLPNGHIVFSSNRQRTSQAVQLDEGKPQYQGMDENNNEPAFVLHVMDEDGRNIKQISFNQSHDIDSGVMANGQIVFSRWDGIGAGGDAISLYRINPDGTGLELLYGRQPCTHVITNNNTGCTGTATAPLPTPIQFMSPRGLQNGRVMALIRPMTGTDEGGDLVSIDVSDYVEYTQPLLPNVGVLNGPGHIRVSPIAVNTEPNVGSQGGRYYSAYPLADNSNRLLVSWSQCRVIENGNTVPCTSQRLDPNLNPPLPLAPPLYGVYIYNLNNNTQLPIAAPQEGIMFTDVVAAAPRQLPPVLLDAIAGFDFPAVLESQSAGVLDIKSVYDFDGADRAPGGIVGVRDVGTVAAAQRPARFLRIEKAVSRPSRDVRDIRGTSYGPTGQFMREIIGYTPIEPDGSVRVRVPANVALQLSVVDANAQRITTPNGQGLFSPRHNYWLQVKPGEVKSCNGCHVPQQPTAATQRSHGRSALFAAANPGAPSSGLFPGADPALWGNPGDTMAFVRAKRMGDCQLVILGDDSTSACTPSTNVIFDDLWTDPAVRAKDASFDYCYTSGPTDVASDTVDPNIHHVCASRLDTPPPVQPACENAWASNCRIVINYLQHLQVLWDLPRPTMSGGDNMCTSCHSTTNPVVNFAPGTCQELVNDTIRVPCGQLDLTNQDSVAQPDHVTSYQKLLFAHNAEELNANMTGLQDICLQTDPMTGTCLQFQVISAPMVALNARGSRFFGIMNNATHAGMMTDAEKRLISEWLDIGAQYYNDPFLAPEN